MSRAAGLAEQILGFFENRVSALEIVPSGGGVFEVYQNGQLIFSKRQSGRFPEWEEIREALS